MDIDRVLAWLQATWFAKAIAENDLLFPWIESIHVLAFVLVVGSIAIVDLRLLGLASSDRPASRVLHDVLPYTWAAFAVAATAGFLLFSSNAVNYAHNFFFRGKLILLAIAALNMILFHLIGIRGIEQWDAGGRTPLAAKTAGTISLAVWTSVVVFGRWTGFTMH